MASASGESIEKLEDMIVRAAETTAAHVRSAKDAIGTVIFGQETVVEHALITVLSGGHAQALTPNHEKVYFTSSADTWVHFQIAGPGAINGHEGWVHAVKGENFGYYSGLSGAHHTYAVFYTPVASQGSEIPTGNEGHVTFVTNPDA